MQEHRLRFTKEQAEEFAKYYKQNHSIKETAAHFNVSYRDILHYLIYFKHYIPKRKQSNIKNYCINERYFENIDTEEKAYFLGMLMSDGYIAKQLYNTCIGLALQKRDRYIVERLNSIISPGKKIYEYKNSCKWSVLSKVMAEDLAKYGIVENKSYSDYVFPIIPKHLERHFIRGYFDGDGCITIKKTGYNVISFCSYSRVFLESLASKLLEYGIKTRPIFSAKDRVFYTLYLSGKENKSVFKKFLYEDATIFLIRKHEKFKGIPC